MRKPVANLIFNFLLIVVLSTALYFSLDWPRETALFPQAVGVPILALSVISFGLEIHRLRRGRAVPEETKDTGDAFADPALLAKAGAVFGWLVGFGVAIWILGFYPAAFAFFFLYIRLQAKLTMVASLSWSVLAIAAIFALFHLFLNVIPYNGMIMQFIEL